MKHFYKNALCFATLLLFTSQISAQQSSYSHVFYDLDGTAQAYSIVKSFDSNYMLAGERDYEGLLMKIDREGNILWDKKYDFTFYKTIFTRLIRTADSNFVVAGTINDDNILCMKTDEQGDTLWTKSIDLGQLDYAVSVEQTSDNGFILAGYSQQTVSPYKTFLNIIKLDSEGNAEWIKQLKDFYFSQAFSARQTTDGGYIAVGSVILEGNWFRNGLIMKLTSDGNIDWLRLFDNSTQEESSFFDAVESGSNYFTFGISAANKVTFIKTELSGELIYCKQYDSYSYYINELGKPFPQIRKTDDNKFLFVTTNQFSGDLFKVDSNCEPMLRQGLFMLTTDVVESYDNTFLIAGNGPIYGVKYAPTNNPQIGINKSSADGLWECSIGEGFTAVSVSAELILQDVAMNDFSGNPVTDGQPLISSSGLEMFNGCVAFVGAVDEMKMPAFSVVPNPAQGSFQIQLNPNENLHFSKLSIYNSEGKLVFSSSDLSVIQNTINLYEQPDGIYFARIVFQEKTLTRKFIIQH